MPSDSVRLCTLHEPTSSLDSHTAGQLLSFVRRVVAGGASCILISHLLGEVLEYSDRIVVMRDAKVVAADRAAALDRDKLVTAMGAAREAERAATERPAARDGAAPIRVRARPDRQPGGPRLGAPRGERIRPPGAA